MNNSVLFQRTELPRPQITAEDAAAILKDHYGLEGSLKELGSQQDRNFRVDSGNGRFVLKISRVEYALQELEAQNAALRHLAQSGQSWLTPQPVAALSGEDIVSVVVENETYNARLLTYLDGLPLSSRTYLSTSTMAAIGRLSAEVALALANFEHAGLERDLQ